MEHLEFELLQRYLAGALEASQRADTDEHLAQCSRCSDTLAALAADEALLTEALALSLPEMAWVESQDLTDAVLHQLSPRFSVAQILILAGLVGLPGLWISGQIQAAGSHWLEARGSLGLLFDVGSVSVPTLIRFIVWLANGGLLTQLWPLFIVGAAFWIGRLSHTKETNRYA